MAISVWLFVGGKNLPGGTQDLKRAHPLAPESQGSSGLFSGHLCPDWEAARHRAPWAQPWGPEEEVGALPGALRGRQHLLSILYFVFSTPEGPPPAGWWPPREP